MSIVSRAARFLASGSLAGGLAVGGILRVVFLRVVVVVHSIVAIVSKGTRETAWVVFVCLRQERSGGLRSSSSHDQGRLAPTPGR